MPCLSSSVDSALNEAIRVSNAESQLALPFIMTTVFGASVISSPNGSAVWTGAGVAAAAGGAVAGLPDGAGAGVAGVAGVAAAGGAGGGDCASAAARPSEIAATGTHATMARRKGRGKFIFDSLHGRVQRSCPGSHAPIHGGESTLILTRWRVSRPLIDISWACPPGRGPRHRFTTLASRFPMF